MTMVERGRRGGESMNLLTVDEVATQLRVSKPSIYTWVKEGRLVAHRLGARTIRFRQEDVDAFLMGATKTAAVVTAPISASVVVPEPEQFTEAEDYDSILNV